MIVEPVISVSVCTRNRADALNAHILPSLCAQNGIPFEVIIISDGSTDHTSEVVASFQPHLSSLKYIYISPDASRGLCAARNAALAIARAPYIFYTDDDAQLAPNFLQFVVEAFRRNPRAVAVCGKTYVGSTDEVQSFGWMHGVNMAFRTAVLRHLQFDEEMRFMESIYYDELDLWDRIKQAKLEWVLEERAAVRHYMAPAVWRNGTRIRTQINHVYSQAKNRSILLHYVSLLYSPFLLIATANNQRKLQDFLQSRSWLHHVAGYHWLWLNDLIPLRQYRTLISAYCLILFVIPWKAWRRRQKEHRRLRELNLDQLSMDISGAST